MNEDEFEEVGKFAYTSFTAQERKNDFLQVQSLKGKNCLAPFRLKKLPSIKTLMLTGVSTSEPNIRAENPFRFSFVGLERQNI